MPVNPKANQNDQLLLMIGQLLEATKIASETIKGLSVDTVANSHAIVVSTTTLEAVEETVSALSRVVSGAGDENLGLTGRIFELTNRIAAIERRQDAAEIAHRSAEGRIRSFDEIGLRLSGGKKVMIGLGALGAWLIATVLAVWTAWSAFAQLHR